MIPFLVLFLGLLFSSLTAQAADAVRCEALFNKIPLNKYEALAEELDLTYLKSPVPAGYMRMILNTRVYLKKDGTAGKTVYYYRYFRPDGSIIRPKLDAEEHKDIVAQFTRMKPDRNWDQVWLSPDENSHIQVLAKNSQGKNVAIYHEDWSPGASQAKFKRVQKFGVYVAELRKGFEKILKNPSYESDSRQKVESAALMLLMSGRIRVGDIKYLSENGTSGVTTLQKKQVFTDEKGNLFLKYIGKSGNKNPINPNYTTIEISNPSLKKTLLELNQTNSNDPRLMIYNRNSNLTALSPDYLNRRLRELTGYQSFSVKDFRTWSANVKTVQELIQSGSPPESLTRQDAILKAVAKNVSRLLNNTPGVARKDYIDPRILNPEGYRDLWQLCKTQFPALLLLKADKKNDFNIRYNPAFENLTLAFLKSLEEGK